MGEDSGATSIASVPKINNGLEKAVMLETSITAQIRVKHISFFITNLSLSCIPPAPVSDDAPGRILDGA